MLEFLFNVWQKPINFSFFLLRNFLFVRSMILLTFMKLSRDGELLNLDMTFFLSRIHEEHSWTHHGYPFYIPCFLGIASSAARFITFINSL